MVKHPVIALVVPVIVLVPLAWYGSGLARDFDMLADLPKDDEARAGFDVLAEHMGAGNMRPLNVLVIDDGRASPRPRAWPASSELQDHAGGAGPRGRGAQRHRRLCPTAPPSASSAQLTAAAAAGARKALAALDAARRSITAPTPRLAARSCCRRRCGSCWCSGGYLEQLAVTYPEVAADPGYQQAVGRRLPPW